MSPLQRTAHKVLAPVAPSQSPQCARPSLCQSHHRQGAGPHACPAGAWWQHQTWVGELEEGEGTIVTEQHCSKYSRSHYETQELCSAPPLPLPFTSCSLPLLLFPPSLPSPPPFPLPLSRPTSNRDFLGLDEGRGLVFVEPVSEVLLEQRCLCSLTHTCHIGPVRVVLLLDEVLQNTVVYSN